MNLQTCTIVLSNNRVLTCNSVEQSLGVIEQHDTSDISGITINAKDGNQIKTYSGLSLEESIESLMNL